MRLMFERASAADAEALVEAQIAAFHYDAVLYPGVEVGGPPGYTSAEHMRLHIREHVCYKIVCEEQIIGGMVAIDEGQGHFHLALIFITPEYHNRGVGTQAMRLIEQAHPALRWTLDTPSWAVRNQHFYEKLGYRKVGEEILPDITLFLYEKHL